MADPSLSDPRGSTSPDDIPQNPFYPAEIPAGPAFLDTAACICAYGQSPVSDSEDAAWQCIGNRRERNRLNATTTGKWFRPLHETTTDGSDLGPIWDASNGPDISTQLMYDPDQDKLVVTDADGLDVYNAACTATNHTSFSTAYYRAVEESRNNERMVDAMPCWAGSKAVPMQIMDLETWQRDGCNLGFLCENNTVNSLPQFCPPVEACQEGRLAGDVCQFNHSNIGMGPFEPVVCQGGYYCPRGGTEKLVCPTGHYCQPGSATPTPCAVGSVCPPGSLSQAFYLPLLILAILDTVLAISVFVLFLRKRARRSAAGSDDRDSVARKSLPQQIADPEQRRSSVAAHPASPASPSPLGLRAALMMQPSRATSLTGDTEVPDGVLTPQLATFVQSMQKAVDTSRFGLSFQYAGLTLHPPGAPKPILQNVTGSIERGTLTAIMGGSGAGKSTFINVLMGKVAGTGGLVMVNDVPNQIKRYKKVIGYVPQDDVVLPELTVRENILHSGRIRLPRDWSDAEIQAHVDCVIECLELAHVQDSLVGTVGKPLISGGQRRRVSIGMELAAAPMAIFLDEPTSGLDATAASSIMRTLRSISGLGISIVVTIHQPRAEIMSMLGDIILLSDGQVVCQGSQDHVQRYLEDLGFSFPPYSNSGDVITDIITGNGRSYKARGDVSKEWLVAKWAGSGHEAKHLSELSNSTVDSTSAAKSGQQKYSWNPSSLFRSGPQSLRDAAISEALKRRGASRFRQTWLCLVRALLQQWRRKTAFCVELTLASLCALLLGLSQQSRNGVLFRGYYRGEFAVLSAAVDVTSVPQLSLLTGVAVGLVSSAAGVRLLSEETLLQRREAEAGHSRAAYLAAKSLAAVPRMVAACLHFSGVMLFLTRAVVPWGVAFAANLAYFWCVYGMASAVAMVVRREDAALVATIASLIVSIMCGAAPTLAQVARWQAAWLWRLSPGVWLTELYFGEMVRPFGHLYQTDVAAAVMGLRLDATGRNIAVLFAIGVVYRLLAYAGLRAGQRLRL